EIDPCRAAGEATVNVVLTIADHHHRRRIGQQFASPLDPSQPADALLVFNRTLAAWRRLDRVVAGPDMRVVSGGENPRLNGAYQSPRSDLEPSSARRSAGAVINRAAARPTNWR